MSHRSKNAIEAIFAGLEDYGGSRLKLAKALGVNHGHIYKAAPISGEEGQVSPTLRKALEDAGWIPEPPKRIRLAADLYDNWADRDNARAQRRRAALRRWARDQGHESWSSWARAKADELLEESS